MVAREGELVVAGRDPGKESQDPDEQKDCAGRQPPPASGGLDLASLSVSVPVRAGEQQPQGDHADPEDQVQPIIGIVERDEVGGTVMVNDQPIDPQGQIDDASGDQILLC